MFIFTKKNIMQFNYIDWLWEQYDIKELKRIINGKGLKRDKQRAKKQLLKIKQNEYFKKSK